MIYRLKLTNQLIRLLEVRQNGTGLFEDKTGRIITDMRNVEKEDSYNAHRGEICQQR